MARHWSSLAIVRRQYSALPREESLPEQRMILVQTCQGELQMRKGEEVDYLWGG